MHWTDDQLASLPVRGGFRLRGLEMTRLETFCDAAFAFAVTLLVVSGDGIPASYDALILALKGVPAFLASFAAIAGLWWAHRAWSRRFGLEDSVTTLISLTFVAVMLVYVYPLKMVFSAFASWATGGFLPSEFTLGEVGDLPSLFVVYGIGCAAQTTLLALLYVRALAAGGRLRLDAMERLRSRHEIAYHAVLAATGLLSASFALVTPVQLGVWAGFVYMTLPVTMTLLSIRCERQVTALQRQMSAASG